MTDSDPLRTFIRPPGPFLNLQQVRSVDHIVARRISRCTLRRSALSNARTPSLGTSITLRVSIVDAICPELRTPNYSLPPEVRFSLIHDATSVTGIVLR